MELRSLKGLGPARLKALNEAGIFSIYDLLRFQPVRYRDTTHPLPISQLSAGKDLCTTGTIVSEPALSFFNGLSRVTLTIEDSTGRIHVIWFNQPWLKKQLRAGSKLLLSGTVAADKNERLFLSSPKIESESAILPVYRSIPGIPSKTLSALITQALSVLETCCPETLPQRIRLQYNLCENNFALRQIHFPDSLESLQIAQRRLTFEQLLLYQAALLRLRGQPGAAPSIPSSKEDTEMYWESFGHPPTSAQARVLE